MVDFTILRRIKGQLYLSPIDPSNEHRIPVNPQRTTQNVRAVGIGPAGSQRPVVIVETWPDRRPQSEADKTELLRELQELAAEHPKTSQVRDILLHPALPVDIRHNAKIFREKLAPWAAGQLRT